MTVLPLVAAAVWPTHHDWTMGQAKSRIVGVLCPGPPNSRASSLAGEVQSLDGFGGGAGGGYHSEEDSDEEELTAPSCCHITGGVLRSAYSPAGGVVDEGRASSETHMVVVRGRHQKSGEAAAGEGHRSTKLVTIAPPPRVHVAHASIENDLNDAQVLFSREVQILRHQCGHHRVR